MRSSFIKYWVTIKKYIKKLSSFCAEEVNISILLSAHIFPSDFAKLPTTSTFRMLVSFISRLFFYFLKSFLSSPCFIITSLSSIFPFFLLPFVLYLFYFLSSLSTFPSLHYNSTLSSLYFRLLIIPPLSSVTSSSSLLHYAAIYIVS